MPKQNKTKYALLGVLSLKPGSGYDIKKFCDFSISHFWNENYGNIYPVLKQLEDEQLATRTTEYHEGRPPRNVYFITEKGKRELDAWLQLPVENSPVRSELLLKLFFGRDIPVANLVDKLEKTRDRMRAILEEYALVEDFLRKEYEDQKGLHLWLATISYGAHNARATIDWCDETIKSLQNMDDKLIGTR